MPSLKRILTAPWRLLLYANYGHASVYTSDEASDAHRVNPRQTTSAGKPEMSTREQADQVAGRSRYGGWDRRL